MRPSPKGELGMRVLGTRQLFIGLGMLFTPASTSRLTGFRWTTMSGAGLLGWQLCALRQILLGADVFGGSEAVRRANWLLQPADLLVFVRSYRSGSISRASALLLSALACTALALLAIGARRGTAARQSSLR